MLDTIIPMLSDAFWGILAFLGIITFFAGNGKSGSVTHAITLLLSSGTYYVVSRYSTYGKIPAFIGAVAILIITIKLFTNRIKTNKTDKQ